MEAAEQIPSPIPSPHMSASKQDRILIWRHEVAAAHILAEDANPDGSSPSSSTSAAGALSSATSTTTSSSSSRSALARGRHVLSKIAHTFSRRPWRARHNGDAEDVVTRTAMYATLSPDYHSEEYDGEGAGDDDGVVPRDAPLREKQARLTRAAKLLDKDRVEEN